MRVTGYGWIVFSLILGVSINRPASVRAADAETGPEWRVRAGLTYANGIWKASDAVYDHYEAEGFDLSRVTIPVGLHLDASAEWNIQDKVSVGPELRLGPGLFFWVEKKDLYNETKETDILFMLPLSLSARCTFLPKAKVSPYARVGVGYVVAAGDLAGNSEAGFEAAGGVEFFRNRRVGFGIEGGYNSCEVKVAGQDVRPVDIFASAYASFKLGK
ncbi:MAG TPA: outer membrane beta-barrel protein [Verrucomicrobiae bacterium]|nr:outer membrane beta-barrel protein [Verrucomicrobiae bacterium]